MLCRAGSGVKEPWAVLRPIYTARSHTGPPVSVTGVFGMKCSIVSLVFVRWTRVSNINFAVVQLVVFFGFVFQWRTQAEVPASICPRSSCALAARQMWWRLYYICISFIARTQALPLLSVQSSSQNITKIFPCVCCVRDGRRRFNLEPTVVVVIGLSQEVSK